MDNALYASMDVVDCNMPCVCENASMSVNPHDCDGMLYEFMGVVNIPNVNPHDCDDMLYESMGVVNIPNVNPHDCDDMLYESMGGVNIPNVKLLKKKFKKFHENLSKFTSEKDYLIAKLNKSNKLVEKYKKLVENSCEKLKEFERLNMDLDTKLVLSNKLVDDLICENESLKMHTKCMIAEPSA